MDTLEQLTKLLSQYGKDAVLALSILGNIWLVRALMREKDKRVALARETGTMVNSVLAVTAKLSEMADWFRAMRSRWGSGCDEEIQ